MQINNLVCALQFEPVKFNVSSDELRYPRYDRVSRNSILNTQDDFDDGSFLELEKRITIQNENVDNFSFGFTDIGIYVFRDSATDEFTVVAIVEEVNDLGRCDSIAANI